MAIRKNPPALPIIRMLQHILGDELARRRTPSSGDGAELLARAQVYRHVLVVGAFQGRPCRCAFTRLVRLVFYVNESIL